MNHERMSFLDFFAGIGTIRIGFEQAGWTCNGHVEWDKFAQASYNAMHEIKEDEYCGWDITKVRADELPRADLWAFGAPCQDFSIAGNRQGLKGERSSLVYEIFRLIEETPEENRPTWLLYENVKGMLSSNGGWDFLGILLEMDRLGYDVEWQLLNSKDWGVPQNRERVFTLGHSRKYGGRKVFPITRTDEPIDTEHKRLNPNMALCKSSKPYVDGKFASLTGDDVTIRDIGCEIAGTVTARYYKGAGADNDNAVMVGINQIGNLIDTDSFGGNPQRGRVYGIDGIGPSLNTVGGGGLEPKVAIPVLTPDRAEKRQNGRRFKEDGEPMFTLTAQDRHGVAIMRPKRTDYGKQIRKQYESGEIEESRHNMTKLVPVFDGISNTITTVQKDNLLLDNRQCMRSRKGEPKIIDDQGRVKDSYKQHDIVPTLRAQTHGNPPKVTVIEDFYKNREPRFYEEESPTLRSDRIGLKVLLDDQQYVDGISDKHSFAKKKAQAMLNEKGELPERFNPYNAQEIDEVSPTLTANCDRSCSSSTVLMKQPNFRIRKLTPKECWRLQGIPDHYFDKASAVNSDSQLYKQAGNACTVNVIFEVARRIGREETA